MRGASNAAEAIRGEIEAASLHSVYRPRCDAGMSARRKARKRRCLWDRRAPARFESERTGERTVDPTDEQTDDLQAKSRSDREAATERGLGAVARAGARGVAGRRAMGRDRRAKCAMPSE